MPRNDILPILAALLAVSCSHSGGGSPAPPPAPRLSFGSPQRFAVGAAGAVSMQFTDFNRDGRPDALTTNRYTGSLSVLLGTGAGLLGSSSTYMAVSPVAAAVVGDIDGDHVVDVVDTSQFQNRVTLRRNDGTGGLTVFGNAPLSQPARDLALAELTGDGRPDLAFTGAERNEVVVLPGDGAGGFGPELALVAPGPLRTLRAVDLDGGGALDLVAVADGGLRVVVFPNTGGGTFAAAIATDTPLLSGAMAPLDANRDGRVDLAVVGEPATRVHVLIGSGAGAFALGTSIPLPGLVTGISTADLDNDGSTDVLVSEGNVVHVAYGDGQGGFSALETVASDQADCSGVAALDLDADGMIDVAYISGGNFVVLLKNPTIAPLGLSAFGTGTPDCLGAMGIFANGRPSLGNSGFAYTVTNAPASSLGMIMLGGPSNPLGYDPFHIGLVMHLQLGFLISQVMISDVNGASRYASPIPAAPGLAGLELFAQTVWLPAQGRGCSASLVGISSSRALRVELQPQ
ncbi:MAG: hypothetical protein Fur0037_06930 [Planctomycetota bacterium]